MLEFSLTCNITMELSRITLAKIFLMKNSKNHILVCLNNFQVLHPGTKLQYIFGVCHFSFSSLSNSPGFSSLPCKSTLYCRVCPAKLQKFPRLGVVYPISPLTFAPWSHRNVLITRETLHMNRQKNCWKALTIIERMQSNLVVVHALL